MTQGFYSPHSPSGYDGWKRNLRVLYKWRKMNNFYARSPNVHARRCFHQDRYNQPSSGEKTCRTCSFYATVTRAAKRRQLSSSSTITRSSLHSPPSTESSSPAQTRSSVETSSPIQTPGNEKETPVQNEPPVPVETQPNTEKPDKGDMAKWLADAFQLIQQNGAGEVKVNLEGSFTLSLK